MSQPLPTCVCDVCGSTHWRTLERFSKQAWLAFSGPVIQCRSCGLARLSEFPSEEELTQYYSGTAYLDGYQTSGASMVTEDAATQAALQLRLSDLESQLGKPGRILDVGASSGAFLAMARTRGWDVAGIELGDEGVRLAKERHDLDLYHGGMETAPFSAESFDVVHASHVLEHLSHPREFLKRAAALLKKDGILAIEVPSELTDLFSWFRQIVLRRAPEPYPVPSPHLFFYMPGSLKQLVLNSGFHVTHLQTPRRNRSTSSRIPLGMTIKSGVYHLEESLNWGPLIELYARKRSGR